MIVQLTPEQIEQLKPLTDMVAAAATAKAPGMLVAQVYADHIFVGFLDHYKAKRILQGIGAEIKMTTCAEDRTGDTFIELPGKHPSGDA